MTRKEREERDCERLRETLREGEREREGETMNTISHSLTLQPIIISRLAQERTKLTET